MSEAIRSRCRVLLNCLGSAMPQEWITVKFCRKHRIVETVHRSDDLAKFVAGRDSRVDDHHLPPGHPPDILEKLITLAGR